MRIGIDLGGTKIEGVVIDADGQVRERTRVPTPRGSYEGTLAAVAELVSRLQKTEGMSALDHVDVNRLTDILAGKATPRT